MAGDGIVNKPNEAVIGINISPDVTGVDIDTDRLYDLIDDLYKHCVEEDRELSLYLCDDAEIQDLNKRYRGKDYPTDVLSFSMEDNCLLGDVVISVPVLISQATDIGHSPEEEFFRLLVHGVLHLKGYDHEINESDAKVMFAKEDEILDRFYKKHHLTDLNFIKLMA